MKYLFILSIIFVSNLSYAKHVHMFHPDGGLMLVFDDKEPELADFSAKQVNSHTLKTATSLKSTFFNASASLLDELQINLLKEFFKDDQILNVIIVTTQEKFYLHELSFYMNLDEESLSLKLKSTSSE